MPFMLFMVPFICANVAVDRRGLPHTVGRLVGRPLSLVQSEVSSITYSPFFLCCYLRDPSDQESPEDVEPEQTSLDCARSRHRDRQPPQQNQ